MDEIIHLSRVRDPHMRCLGSDEAWRCTSALHDHVRISMSHGPLSNFRLTSGNSELLMSEEAAVNYRGAKNGKRRHEAGRIAACHRYHGKTF